jgi:hypothetical protein
VKPRRTYTKIIAEQDGYIASLENECARLEKKIARLERIKARIPLVVSASRPVPASAKG